MEENEKKLIEKAKKTNIIEGGAFSIMDGFGLRYITPYALALKSPNYIIGFLSSFPQLIGNFGQILTLKLMRKYSRKKILLITVFTQAFLWIPLLLTGLIYYFFNINTSLAIFLLITFYTLLIFSGSLPSPAWNSWMKDIIKENKGDYFGNRNRVINIITVLSMLLTGIILNHFKDDNVILGFAIIFFIAFLGRLFSGFLFINQYEPEFKFEEEYYFSFAEFVKKMKNNNFGRFVIFISLISLTTAIAAPFFSVYMLKNLGFSYIEFTIVSICSIVVTSIFMPFWGRYTDKVGTVKVMKITGLFLFTVPIGYVITFFLIKYNLGQLSFPILIITECFSGFIWAGFNLSAANFIFDSVTRQRLAICVAYYNSINTLGTFIGATIGGVIASFNLITIPSLIIVFIVSALGRLIAFLIMGKKIKEVRKVDEQEFTNYLIEELKNHNKKIKSKIKSFEKEIIRIFTFKTDKSTPIQIEEYQ
ncbi:MAG: MFS transporter [Candidatus Pacearchaeota archaeon]